MSIYYVAPTGSDANPGTQAQPWQTLSKAASSVQAGDTVYFANGSYTGGVTCHASGTAAAPITFLSTNRWGAKIVEPAGAGMGTSLLHLAGDYTVVDGFEVTGPDAQYGIFAEGNFDTIQHNWVHDVCNTLSPGSSGGEGISNWQTNYAGSGCTITDNRVERIGPKDANGNILANQYIHPIYVMCGNSAGAGTISNNLVLNGSGWGIAIYHNPNRWVVTNNTIIHCLTGGLDCWGDVNSGYIADYNTIQNNLFVDCGAPSGWKPAIWSQSDNCGAHNIFRDNLAYFHGGTAVYDYTAAKVNPLQTGTNLTNADPKFVNYQADGSGDYHLASGSPAINTATSTLAPSTDFDGNPRPYGSAPDCGCYERQSA